MLKIESVKLLAHYFILQSPIIVWQFRSRGFYKRLQKTPNAQFLQHWVQQFHRET